MGVDMSGSLANEAGPLMVSLKSFAEVACFSEVNWHPPPIDYFCDDVIAWLGLEIRWKAVSPILVAMARRTGPNDSVVTILASC